MTRVIEAGHVRFIHKRSNPVAATIGRLGALPYNILYGTPRGAFQNPSVETTQALAEGVKDIPFNGNVEVYMNHSGFFRQMRRLFQKERRTALPARIIFGIPAVFLNLATGSIGRVNSYNPWTESAQVYHPSLAIAAHEVGMAKTYDKARRPSGRAWLNVGNNVAQIQDFEASKTAMDFLTDAQKREAVKILEPKYLLTIPRTPIGTATKQTMPTLYYAAINFLNLVPPAIVGHVHARSGNRGFFYDLPERQDPPAPAATRRG